jgi:branched-chain amino acid transport system permease protein
MSEGVAPVRNDRPVLAGMIAAMVGVYVLRRVDVYANWPFVILLFLCLVAGNYIAQHRLQTRAMAEGGEAEEEVIDLEWVGITSPWTPDRLAEVNSALNLDGYTAEIEAHGEAASARA